MIHMGNGRAIRDDDRCEIVIRFLMGKFLQQVTGINPPGMHNQESSKKLKPKLKYKQSHINRLYNARLAFNTKNPYQIGKDFQVWKNFPIKAQVRAG